jgi:hypothetical protein
MYRLAYRNFGDHEAMVVNHSVVAGSSIGVRWYELRSAAPGSAFSLFQQGTFAPDATYRWMGSAAMDGAGDIGIGYSASSSTMPPAIRYTGRTPELAPGTLQSEVSLIEGTGSQTGGLSRWGDYTAMRIDPADDCTFWYTNEYLQSNGSFNWKTFFGSFTFASCVPPTPPDFAMSASPSSLTLMQGASGTSTVTVTSMNGFSSAVALTIGGCPAGATCSLAPSSVTPTAASTLSVTTGTASPGTATLTITGTGGGVTHSTTVALTINAQAPDFSISASPAQLSINRSSTGQYTVTVAKLNSTASVKLQVSGLPAHTHAVFSPNPVTGGGTSTSALTITVDRNAKAGANATLKITGNNGSKTHTTTVMLHIN